MFSKLSGKKESDAQPKDENIRNEARIQEEEEFERQHQSRRPKDKEKIIPINTDHLFREDLLSGVLYEC